MSAEGDDRAVVAGIRSSLRAAAESLEAAHAHDEALARFVPARRTLVVMRKSALIPLGRVWRLGVFLLSISKTGGAATAGAPAGDGVVLYETGKTTRAVDPLYPGFQSVSAETRRDYRGAAYRGPFERGETVNFDAALLKLDADSLRSSPGPLVLRDSEALVRWAVAIDVALVPFDTYLAERIDLLVHPQHGA